MDIQELQSYNLGDAIKFNDKLNPKLWGKDEHLRPEVKSALMRIADDFREFLGVTDIELKDITVSGSNAAYTYTDHSDIDLHLVVDLPKADVSEIYRELFDAKKYQYNNQHDFKIGNYDVELYVQNANEPHVSQGIYSLLNDEWISVPSRRKPDVNDISVKSKYEDLGHRIEQAVASGDRSEMDRIWHKVKEIRKAGLAKTGEFGPENLAFKVLRNNGTLQKLIDARKAIKDKEMSLAEKAKPPVKYGYKSLDKPTRSPEELAQLHNVSVDAIMQQLQKGIQVEKEHTSDEATAREIALDHLAEFPDYYDRLERAETNESIDNTKAAIKSFVRYCAKELELEKVPAIRIKRDPSWSEQNGTFGQYDPATHTMIVSIANRHVVDVMRTIAHELAHRRQDELGTMPADSGKTGSPYENEANAIAGVIMRNFGQAHPEYFVLAESSGYIPVNDAEAKDPRWSMALTQDIKPGETQRQAAKMGWSVDKAGVPPLLMSKLQNKLSVIKEGREVVNEEELFEVAMSPTALRSWAETPAAQGIRAGFEAELIFRNAENDDNDSDSEPDYDINTTADSIDSIIEFFSDDSQGHGLGRRDADMLERELQRDYDEWMQEQINDLWYENAESQVEDYMEMNVWGDDGIRKGMIKSQLKSMDLSKEEIAKALDEEKENKHYLEAWDLAREEFESDIRYEIRREGDYYDEAKDYYVQMMSDSGDYSESDWLDAIRLRYMTNVAYSYGLDWPIYSNPYGGGTRSPEEIAASLGQELNVDTTASRGYHSVKRRPGLWIVEPDSSLESDSESDGGLEVISPPMPLPEALSKLKELIEWAQNSGDAYTNESTGLHMGVSVPGQESGTEVDYIKLIMFLGDKHVLEQFGRGANTYCRSAYSKIQRAAKGSLINADQIFSSMRKNLMTLAGRYVSEPLDVGRQKYTSAHIQNGYIEFRSPGGDYLNKVDKEGIEALENTMLRFARAMQIAADPEADKKEYAKKLYKTITLESGEFKADPKGGRTRYQPEVDPSKEFINLFAKYASGEIGVDELKDQWASNVLQSIKSNEEPISPYVEHDWEVYNKQTGEIIDTFKNMVHGDAWALARNKYGDHPDRIHLSVRTVDNRKPAPSDLRKTKAQALMSRERYWEVKDPYTGVTEIVKAKSSAEAIRAAIAQSIVSPVLTKADNNGYIKAEPIATEKAKELLAKKQQEKDAAKDAKDLQQTVQGQTVYYYEVVSRDGAEVTIKADSKVHAQRIARERFPDLFGGPGSVVDIRTVSGLTSAGEPRQETPATNNRFGNRPLYTYRVTNSHGTERTVRAINIDVARTVAAEQYPTLFAGPDQIYSVVLQDEPSAQTTPAPQPAPFPSREEPEYQIVHRRTGHVIYRFAAPSVEAAQDEFRRRTDNDPQNFGLYPVLAESINEGWRDWVMGAGVGAMALGGGSAAYDAYKAAQPQAQQQAQVTQGQVKKVPQLPLKQMSPAERIIADAAQKAGIVGTELKQFLAQMAHESANFTSMEEFGTSKYFAKKYDKKYNPVKAKTLGNIHPGDGEKYKGRGYVQLTGRYNYAKAGEALGLPLLERPELAARPDIAAKIAVWFWKQRVQPKVQDYSDVKAATKPINPALKGIESRKAHYDKYAQSSIPAPKKPS